MAFELIPITEELWVEGQSDEVGDYNGRVIAIAMRDTDPVSAPQPEDASANQTEGLHGWGSTYFLVASSDHRAPVWITKDSVRSHRMGDEDD